MNLAKFIDHTLLKPDATEAEIIRLCDEAVEHGFHSVCVNGSWVPVAVRHLQGSGVTVAAVTGFPLGAMTTKAKVFETRTAIADGAGEIDTVIAIGKLKSGCEEYVREELREIVQAADGRTVKVILETCLLTGEEIERGCRLAVDASVHFVKTSTGFNKEGATLANVGRMKVAVAGRCEIKASGGIRDRDTALAFLAAGATRLGTSSGVAIVSGESAGEAY